MKCDVCRGACCESLYLPVGTDARGEWLRAFAARTVGSGGVEIETRCSKLTADGRCSIYSARPDVCRAFKAGGAACLDVVRRRRTPEEYAAIRHDDDPLTL